jgi:anthranilate synthase
MSQLRYTTPHGIVVTRTRSKVAYGRGLHKLLKQLDTQRGVYLSSGYEYPERYSRWDVASVSPPLQIVGQGRSFQFQALNQRGEVLLRLLAPLFVEHPHVLSHELGATALSLHLHPLAERFPEEERSKQPSPFSLLRAIVDEFKNPDDSRLMFIGAFGYDLLLAV